MFLFLHFELKTNNKQFLQNILIRNFTLTVVMMLQSASIQLYMASESKVQTPMRNITIQLFRINLVKNKTKQDVQES
jgi:hypothetical protein